RNGNDEITLRTFVLRDPSSAYEVYTFLLSPGMTDWGLGKDSAAGDAHACTLIGNLVVTADVPSGVKSQTFQELVSALKEKANPTPFPPLKAYLPERWRIFGSEKYALGPEAFRAAVVSLQQDAATTLADEVGFKDGVEAIFAGYRGQHGSGILLLLEYPTPQ